MKSDLLARHAALRCIASVMQGEALEAALDEVHASSLAARDRAFARTLAMQVLRRAGECDAVLARFIRKPLAAGLADVQHALRLGVVQLLWLHTPPHAAIATTVELIKRLKQPRLAGLANAVLRQVAAASETLADARDGRLNTPEWLWRSWVSAYGEAAAQAIADAHTHEPPLDLSLRRDIPDLAGERVGPQTLRRETTDVTTLPGYAEGAWWVQDVAASLPAHLLGDVSGRRVWDLCAAPGGKTAQLAAAGAEVLAVDRSAKRLARLQENMHRLGLTVTTRTADLLDWQPDASAEAVLLDAPCSATGTIRRHPDILYQRTPAQVAETEALQRDLLARAARWVSPGGQLVYCVCSLQPTEGEAPVREFLQHHPQWRLAPIDPAQLGWPAEWVREGMLRTLPHWLPGGMDGFFAARLIRC